MITVPEVVQKIVKTTPLLEEGLSKGLINYSAFAREYKPRIQEELMKPVQDGAIVMALKRMGKNIRKRRDLDAIFSQPPEMMVRSNLFEVTIKHMPAMSLIHRMGKIADIQESYFLTLTQGVFESTIIASKSLQSQIMKLFSKSEIISTISDLSAITIKLPTSNVTTPGVYYTLLKSLAWEEVNIIEVVSTSNEDTIIVKTADVDRAFVLLKNVFS